MGSLANQYISQSYKSLIHLGSDTTISSSYTDLQDGLGNTLNISVNAQGDISASGNIFAANLSAITYDTGSLLTTASANLNTITFTKGNGSTFNVTVNTGSAGGSTDISSLNAFTASIAGTNAFTASAQNSLNSLNAATSSYITSAVTSSMAVSSSLYAVTASLAREVIISAINANQSTLPIGTVVRISGANGDNPNFNTASFIDEANSSNTLGVLAHTAVSGQSADITVIGKLIGVNTQGMNAGDLLYLSSSGQFTNVQPQAPLQIVVLGEVLRVQQNNGSIFVNVSNGWELNELHNVRIVSPQQGDLLVYEASSSLWKNQPSSSFATSAITGSSLVTASVNVNVITFTKGNGSTFDLTVSASGSVTPGTISGSAQISALGFVTSSITGSSVVTASFSGNTLTFTKGDSTTFGVVLPDVSGSTIDTGSLVTSASFNAYTSSTNQRLNSIEALSGSWVTAAITASSLVTASFSGNTLTFTKGNGTTFGLQIPDVSGSTINTGSFATTGSNNFVGTENINGQLNVTGSSSFTGSMNFLSGSASGSVVTNIGDTFTGTAAVTKIISLNSAEYSALTPKDPNTLYIIV